MRIISLGLLSALLLSATGCTSSGTRALMGGFNSAADFGPPHKPTPQGQAYSRYIAAVFLEEQGRYEEAQQELERVARLDPNAMTPSMRLVRAYLRKHDYELALRMAQRAAEQAPERANTWLTLGEIYHQLQRFEEANTALQKAITLNPDNVLGYGALVELQESTNDLVAAVNIYERLIEMSPEVAALHFQLGINLIRINDNAGARAALARALELSDGLVRAQYFLGVLALEADDDEESVKWLQRYVESRADDAQAQQVLAGALTRLGRHEEARQVMDTLLALDEAQPRNQLWASYVALLAGQPEESEQLLPPEGAPLFSSLFKAFARQDQGLPHEPLLESLGNVDADLNAECDRYLNDMLYLFGQETTGQKLLARFAGYAQAGISNLSLSVLEGRVLMALKRGEEAAAVFERVLEEHPDFDWAHYYLAVVYDELKDFEKTEKHLKIYLENHPDNPEILNFLGYLYAEEGVKLDEAEVLLNRALELDPENPYYLDSLGWVYYKQGKADEAIELIQRAIYLMDNDDAILRDHLGDAYLLQGDVQRAIGEWERALRLKPDLEGVREKLEKHRLPQPGDGLSTRAS